MRLYLMRHGHSPSASDAGVASDAERPLSERGRSAVRKMAESLLKSGGKPGVILHSPWRRADESAREAAGIIRPRQTLALEALANAVPADVLFDELRGPLRENGELLAVGHQPLLGELTAMLCGQLVDLRPAGLVALDIPESGPARLSWSRNADQL